MSLESRLMNLKDFDVRFEIKRGYYHIAVKFKDGWKIITPEDDAILVKQKNEIVHYIASVDNINIIDIFDAIDSTIKYNTDLEKKLELFKEKTEELQRIFANEEYEALKKLEFYIHKPEKPKKTQKKKSTKTEKPKKSKKATKKSIEKEEAKEIVEETGEYYDENQETITSNGEFIEELERK